MRGDAFASLDFLTRDTVFFALAALFAASLCVSYANAKFFVSPRLFVISRILRLLAGGLAIGWFLRMLAVPDGQILMLAAGGCLIYLLFESALYWLELKSANLDRPSLFARFAEVPSAWSPEARFLKLKREIEKEGFSKCGASAAVLGDGVSILSTGFISQDRKTLLNVSFLPFAAAAYAVASSAVSFARDGGEVYYTDGVFMPFGLSFPPNYKVRRLPLGGANPLKLLRKHAKLVKGAALAEISETPLEIQNKIYADIEAQASADGLLNAPSDRDEYGVLSSEGLYRVWKSIFTLNYLGRGS